MNKKLLLMGLVAPALITACTNDDFVENMGNTSLNGDMINTSDLNFVVTKGEGVDTKAIWDAVEGADGQYTYSFKWEKSNPNSVGLAYVGSATGVSGVTNYKFAVDSLQLADYKSLGKKVDEVTYTTGFYQIGQELSKIQEFYTKADGQVLTATDIVTSESAKFKTTNDQIMRGYYVGYYPFDENFQDPGMIPVRTSKRLEIEKPAAGTTLEAANLTQVGENSFAYTAPTKLEPGSQVTYLNMQQLTSMLRLEISNTSDAALKIRTVILRTKGNDLFTIAGTLKNPAAAPAASNIDVKETSSTIAVAYPYVKDTPASTQLLEIANDADGNVYFPILPGTFNTGLDVILINQEGKACEIEYNFKNATTSFASGKGYKFSVEVTKDTKFDKSFVTSESEFMEAWDAATKSSTSYTINLLGDVVIEDEDLSFEHTGKDVVVNASAGSKLVVKNSPINLPCTLVSGTTTPNGQKLIINATTEFEGLTMYGVVELNGATTFKGGNQVGTTIANGDLKDAWGQLYINDEATIVKDAKINAVNSWGVIVGENATFTVDEGAEYNNLVAIYGTTGPTVYKSDLIIYGEMIVDGKLTDKGDTKIESGKLTINGSATNYNTVNGTDATIVVNGTYTNESSEGKGTGKAGAGNIKITTGTLSVGTTGKLYNKASLNCMGDFVNDGTFYDYVGSVYGGKPYTSNGTYACYVNSAARLAEAYTRLGIYAKDKTQKIILQEVNSSNTSYDLSSAAAKNVNFENEGNITISSTKTVTHKIMSFTVTGENKTVTFSDDMMISGSDEIVPLTINAKAKAVFTNDIEVKINGEIINNGTFDLQPASDEDNLPATVYSTEIDVTKGTWTNYPLVQPSEAFWTGW